ncbi:MAG: DMT family transporter [Paracoccaceae bacterium]|nr:DMT family transporter [Paracoccaceae bacterium]
MQPDRPLMGILMMLGFCVLAPMGDAVAKMLAGQLPLGQIVFLRFAIQALILIPLTLATGRVWRMSARVTQLVALRTVLHIAGIGMMYSALYYLPLADAIAIAFVMPFIMLLLGWWVLDEEVGTRRLAACAVGFIGTLLVVQPAFASVGWPALLPLGVAVTFALFMLVTRQVARETDPIGMQAVSGIMATLMLAPLLLLAPLPDLSWQAPTANLWLLLVYVGVIGTLAHLLMTWSLRYAPAATLAPMQYLEIPFATLIGFLLFADLPNRLASLGIAITIAAGLYIVMRERAILRGSAPAPGTAPAGPPEAG